MLRDLFIAIFVYASFLNAEATMSSYGVHPNIGVSLNRSSLFTNIDPMINGASSDRSEHVYVSNARIMTYLYITLLFFFFCVTSLVVLSSN